MWAWREMPVIGVYPWTMRASLGACTRAVGRYTLARESSLLGRFGHEDNHGRVQGGALGAELPPDGCADLRQVAGCHGRSLEIFVSPHVPQDAGGLYLRGPG